MLKLRYKLLDGLERRLWKLPQSCVCRSATCYGEQLIGIANPDHIYRNQRRTTTIAPFSGAVGVPCVALR